MFAVFGVLWSLWRVSGFGLSRCGNTLLFKGTVEPPARRDQPITARYVTLKSRPFSSVGLIVLP